jgi:hypothetical protein
MSADAGSYGAMVRNHNAAFVWTLVLYVKQLSVASEGPKKAT